MESLEFKCIYKYAVFLGTSDIKLSEVIPASRTPTGKKVREQVIMARCDNIENVE